VLIRPADVPDVPEPSNDLVMRPLVAEDDVSATWVRIDGTHRRLRTDRSTRLYIVLDGDGWFELGDDPRFELRAADVVVVPRGVPYAIGGGLTYVVVNGPGFREGDDVYV
jgi:mannose-6-phosphate isomerase-like protein (cupin superfamily)